jgi:hypothetical protein
MMVLDSQINIFDSADVLRSRFRAQKQSEKPLRAFHRYLTSDIYFAETKPKATPNLSPT